MHTRYEMAERVSYLTLLGNVGLTLIKLIVSLTTTSVALMADTVHSGSDALSTLVVLFGIKVAKSPPDEEHPYGHGRAETLVASILALSLIVIGIGVMWSAVTTFIAKDYSIPSTLALWATGISVLAKEVMYRYTVVVGKRTNSNALIADAWHHRSDAVSSIAAFIGIYLARLGWPLLDPLVATVVAFFVIRVGWSILRVSIDELMDGQEDMAMLESVRTLAVAVTQVHSAYNVKVHKYGADYHVDLVLRVPANLRVSEAHDLSHKVKDSICKELPQVTHVDIHVEPEVQEKSEESRPTQSCQ